VFGASFCRYKPAEWLKDYRRPIKIVLAELDEVIPIKFGRRLFDSYTGPKTLQIVPNAHHNDIAAQSSRLVEGNLFILATRQPTNLRYLAIAISRSRHRKKSVPAEMAGLAMQVSASLLVATTENFPSAGTT